MPERDSQGRFVKGDGYSINDRSDEVLAIAMDAVEKAIARGTIKVQTEARRIVAEHSSPPASAPGEPPHLDTGTLARSIDEETYRTNDEFRGRVGSNVNYAAWLEDGTAKMAPRPYLRPALDSQRNEIIAEIQQAGKEMK